MLKYEVKKNNNKKCKCNWCFCQATYIITNEEVNYKNYACTRHYNEYFKNICNSDQLIISK